MTKFLLLLTLIFLSSGFFTNAYEPSPLQDFCVADTSMAARVNGLTCKNPTMVLADDFHFSGLHIAGNTSNAVGSRVTPVTVAQTSRPQHSLELQWPVSIMPMGN
ncbi:hypothetical protein Leryth_001238 [Lithospermum erythrorhizon]|nr:hypothetical protein Leryth_001238 [Lithospermum erythrorhizon]